MPPGTRPTTSLCWFPWQRRATAASLPLLCNGAGGRPPALLGTPGARPCPRQPPGPALPSPTRQNPAAPQGAPAHHHHNSTQTSQPLTPPARATVPPRHRKDPGWLLPGWCRAQEPLPWWCRRENLHQERPQAGGEVGTCMRQLQRPQGTPCSRLAPGPTGWKELKARAAGSQVTMRSRSPLLPETILPQRGWCSLSQAAATQFVGCAGRGRQGPRAGPPHHPPTHRRGQSLPSGTKGVTLPSHRNEQDTARSIQCTPGLPMPRSSAQPGGGEAV